MQTARDFQDDELSGKATEPDQVTFLQRTVTRWHGLSMAPKTRRQNRANTMAPCIATLL
jgi:hypothetical protein